MMLAELEAIGVKALKNSAEALLSDKIPEKGEDIIATDNNDNDKAKKPRSTDLGFFSDNIAMIRSIQIFL